MIRAVTPDDLAPARLRHGASLVSFPFLCCRLWPGVGRLTYEAVIFRDYPLLQAVILLKAIIVLGVNLGVDIVYAYLDPRVRYA